MKKLFVLWIAIMFCVQSEAQNYTATTGVKCSAYVYKEGVLEAAPYITESITLTMDWLYCGPWSGNDSGTLYLQIFTNGDWQLVSIIGDSGNGCTWVSYDVSISAALWNSAIDAGEGDVRIRAYASDSCPGGVGCSFYSDPCFEASVGFDYEPIESAESLFSVPSIEVCVGEAFVIEDQSSGSGLEYDWDFGADATPAGSNTSGDQEISYGSAGTKTITLVVSNVVGESTYQVDIEVNPVPEISTSDEEEVCAGSDIDIEVIGIGEVSWSNGLGTSNVVNVSPSETTTYYVSLTNELGCASNDSIIVVVNSLPMVDAGEDVDLCLGESTTLQAQGEGNLIWDNGLGMDLEPTVAPIETTSYTLTATDENECSSTDVVIVSVFELPIAFAGEDATICDGDTYTLEASGGTQYEWDNGLGNSPILEVAPESTTTYVVEVSNEAGCSSTSSVEISVNDAPDAYAGEDVEVCFGELIELLASGGVSYYWDQGLGEGQSQEIIAEESATYTVTVGNEFECYNTDEVSITVNELPEVDAGSDIEICSGEEAQLLGVGEGVLTWSNDPEAQAMQVVAPVETTSYTLSSVGENGCENDDEVLVIVYALPIADAGDDQDICVGEIALLVGSGGTSYEWNNGLGIGQTHEVTPSEDTEYVVVVESAEGCVLSDSVVVYVHELPLITVSEGGEICPGDSYTISVSGDAQFEWDNGLGSNDSYDVSPEETTVFSVVATNEFGCQMEDEVEVYVFPNVEVSLIGISDQPYCNNDLNAYNMLGNPSGGEYSGNGVEGNQFFPSFAGIGPVEITYTYEDDNGCSFQEVIYATVENCSSVEEYEEVFQIFPNPVRHNLTIKWDASAFSVGKISLFDLKGRLVIEQFPENSEGIYHLELRNLLSGTYLMLIADDQGHVVRREVIKE